jgi:hypothetical protein
MRQFLLDLAALLAPVAASACPVCFGALDNKSGLAAGFWWGIVILLAATMSLVAAIGWSIWTVERRRAEADA